MIKSTLKKIIENSSFLSKIFLKVNNTLRGGRITLPGMNIRNNRITMDANNSLICGGNCNIQNNIVSVSGRDNHIIIGNNVQIYGDDKNASFLIWGDDNRIEIEDNCRLTNVQFLYVVTITLSAYIKIVLLYIHVFISSLML